MAVFPGSSVTRAPEVAQNSGILRIHVIHMLLVNFAVIHQVRNIIPLQLSRLTAIGDDLAGKVDVIDIRSLQISVSFSPSQSVRTVVAVLFLFLMRFLPEFHRLVLVFLSLSCHVSVSGGRVSAETMTACIEIETTKSYVAFRQRFLFATDLWQRRTSDFPRKTSQPNESLQGEGPSQTHVTVCYAKKLEEIPSGTASSFRKSITQLLDAYRCLF